MNKSSKKHPVIWILAGIFILGTVCARLYAGHAAGAGEEDKADTLTAAYLQGEVPTASEADNGTSEQECRTDCDYSGTIDCVLDIPVIDMQRIVITGGDMDYNLARHLFVTMSQNMRYGSCSYIIGGHQSFIYGYSMNRLEELKVGDYIYITKDGDTDTFIVTETCSEQWGIAAGDYGDDPDKLAIYTCRKQKKRPKPYIVVRAEKAADTDVTEYKE